MPGFTTHYLFGQQAYQLIRDAGQKQAIQNFHTVFSLGLQGPDIYFYDILSHFLAKKNPGSIAHTADTGKFLAHLLKAPMIFSTGKERKIAQVYILGYIGHYLLDTACHPYVCCCITKISCLANSIKTKALPSQRNSVPSSPLCCIMPFPKHIPGLMSPKPGFFRPFTLCGPLRSSSTIHRGGKKIC